MGDFFNSIGNTLTDVFSPGGFGDAIVSGYNAVSGAIANSRVNAQTNPVYGQVYNPVLSSNPVVNSSMGGVSYQPYPATAYTTSGNTLTYIVLGFLGIAVLKMLRVF